MPKDINGPRPPNQSEQRLSFTPAIWNDGAPPPREWLVEGCFPIGTVVLVSGDGGLGKSLLMQQLLTAAGIGRNWLGMKTRSVRGYGLFCEDDRGELQRRQCDINRHYGCSMSDLGDVSYVARPGEDNVLCRFDRFSAEPIPTKGFYVMVEMARRFGSQLIVLDTASDVFGGNEIAKDQVRAFVSLLRGWAMEIGGCVVLTSHVSNEGLESGSGLSGSRAWRNSTRAMMWLTSKSKEGGNERWLKTMKSNYGPAGGKIQLKWDRGVFVRCDPPPPRDFSEPLPGDFG